MPSIVDMSIDVTAEYAEDTFDGLVVTYAAICVCGAETYIATMPCLGLGSSDPIIDADRYVAEKPSKADTLAMA